MLLSRERKPSSSLESCPDEQTLQRDWAEVLLHLDPRVHLFQMNAQVIVEDRHGVESRAIPRPENRLYDLGTCPA